MASAILFSYVLSLREYIVVPSHILEHADALAFVAMLWGPLVWMFMGSVCGVEVRNVAWVVPWAYVGRVQAMTESHWKPMIMG
jgi:hypothetical protein